MELANTLYGRSVTPALAVDNAVVVKPREIRL